MKLFPTNNLVSVINVSNYNSSLAWYQKWLGEPNEIPMEGVAEWRIADNAWLQLSSGEPVGNATVVIGVDDVSDCRNKLIAVGIEAREIVDWDVVLVCDLTDLEGNTISLVQMKE